jgi:hypothetical protein
MLKELRKTRYGGYQIMCMRFHPKEHHVLLAGTSEGLVFLCNTETGDITEKLSGTTAFVLLNISSKFLLHLECYLLSPTRLIKINK